MQMQREISTYTLMGKLKRKEAEKMIRESLHPNHRQPLIGAPVIAVGKAQ